MTSLRAIRSGSSRSRSPEPETPVPHGIEIELIDRIKPMVHDLVTARAATLADLRYAGVRLEVSAGRYATGENGGPKASGDDRALAFGIRVLAGKSDDRAGLFRAWPGRRRSLPPRARSCAMASSPRIGAPWPMPSRRRSSAAKYPGLGEALADTRLAPVPVRQEVVPAVYDIDPARSPSTGWSASPGTSRRASVRSTRRSATTTSSTSTALCRELFASSEGALIDQSFALTQGLCFAVAAGRDNSQEVYDVLGHQRGWEILEHGVGRRRHPIPAVPGVRRRHRARTPRSSRRRRPWPPSITR